MKKLILSLALLFCYTADAQNWNIGIGLGGYGNYSMYKGGMKEASALFTNNLYSSPQISGLIRYRYNEHWSLQSGFDFGEIGFSYFLSHDYDLTKPLEQFEEIKTGTCIAQIPLMAIYNSKLNCKNVRFIAGGGLTLNFIEKVWDHGSNDESTGGIANSLSSDLLAVSKVKSTTNAGFTWMIGAEKVFKRGNMLSFTLRGNYGFSSLADATVNYSVNGKDYMHTFSNNGSWCGMAVTYYFLPLGSKKNLQH